MALKSPKVAAFFWSSIDRVGTQAVRVFFALVLARILSPADFGLMAMLTVFVSLAQIIVSSGFGTVLIQRKAISHRDECSAFYCNLAIGGVLTVVLFFSAPQIASFYNSPHLTSLARAMAFNVLIYSFSVVQGSLLVRKLDFRTQCTASMASGILSGVIGVAMAAEGFGVWSLVYQQITGSLINVGLLWWLSGWLPLKGINWQSVRSMFSFSSSFLAINLADAFVANLSSAIIGRMFSAMELGLYSRARQMQELPVSTCYNTISRPSISVFAASQSDTTQLTHHFRIVITLLAMVVLPAMTGLAVVAKPLVVLLLTPRWVGCVPALQCLCAVGALYPLQRINLNLLVGTGHSREFLRLEFARNVLEVMILLICCSYGVIAMIGGQVVVMIVAWVMNGVVAGRLIHHGVPEQVRDVLPYALASAFMAAAMEGVGVFRVHSQLEILVFQTLIGIGSYIGICSVFRLPAFLRLRQIATGELGPIIAGVCGVRV